MGFQTDLEKWASSIREEMRLREAQENSGFREESRSIFKFVTEEQKRAKQRQILAAKAATKNKVLDCFSKYDYETAQKQIRKAGNTSLHKRHVQYQEWKDSLDSCTLVFTGKLGSGKSVLMANIVGDLNLSTAKEPPLVAYFFCRHDIQESLQARTILGSLARQLLRTLSDLEILSENGGNSHIASSTDKVLESFLKGYSPSQMTYFVIDGLDECDETERRILVDAFQKIQKKLKALFCISLRIEPNKGLSFITEQLLATRVVPLPEKNPDIDAFIEADLRRCLEQELLTIGDATLIIDIQDALVAGSQGMFLWAALQIQSLCSMKTDHAIRNALADLPRDISQTFARILDKSGRSDPSLQAKTLQVVLAAERPLTTEELREALSVIPGDADWDPSKMLNDVYSALTCCGCLLTIDEEESTVRVVHHSVKQYILHGLNNVKHTSFSIGDAQRTLADIVITYLGYGVFETQLSRVNNRPIIPQSAPSSILQSAMGSSRTARNLAMKLLANRKQPTFDLSKTIAEVRGSSNCQPENAFKFYSYTKTHWQRHIWYVSGHQGSIYGLAAKVIQSRTFEIEEHPSSLTACGWATEHGNMKLIDLLFQASQHKRYYTNDLSTPLLWAIHFGHKDLVKALLSAGADVNECGSYDIPLRAAVSRNDEEMVELLLKSKGIDVNAQHKAGETALMRTTLPRQDEIPMIGMAKLLLGTGKADPNLQNKDGETALTCAAMMGHTEHVKLLLASGSNPNLETKDGETALMQAAWRGRTKVVELLVNYKDVDVNAKDEDGQTALMQAAQIGHIKTVGLLVNNKDVDINAKDSKGQTARMLAASKRSRRQKDIVELLDSYSTISVNRLNPST
jgi:ankyrin repeat protein